MLLSVLLIRTVLTMINGCLLNTRSIVNKTQCILDTISDYKIDLMLNTETWLANDASSRAALNILEESLQVHHIDRSSGVRGGGVAALVKPSAANFVCINLTTVISFEFICGWLKPGRTAILCIYRPPHRSKAEFLHELDDSLSQLTALSERIILTGDFNLHLDKADDCYTQSFFNICRDHGLRPQVEPAPTHSSGHCLDFILSTFHLDRIRIISNAISDHHMLLFSIPPCETHLNHVVSAPPEEYLFRDLKAVDTPVFHNDMVNALPGVSNSQELFDLFHNMLDKHAPLQKRKRRAGNKPFKYSHTVSVAKRKRRKLERQYIKSQLSIHREMLIHQRSVVASLVRSEKAAHFKKIITSNSNTRSLFNVVSRLTEKSSNSVLPLCFDSMPSLCTAFGEYFIGKVQRIVGAIRSSKHPVPPTSVPCHCPPNEFCEFSTLSEDDTMKLRRLKISLTVDILPLELMQCIHTDLTPVFTRIINQSLSTGVFPSHLKQAIITPLLKSDKLDKNELSSYRPVSNLSYVSKLIETAVCNQLTTHIKSNNLWHGNQSAYRQHHSVESALLSVSSSILEQLDCRRNVYFLMLDLSAAFDTVDHGLLLETLSCGFGVGGVVLSWIRSYLTDRTFRVKCANTTSSAFTLDTGVPQGSILGPVLFNCYMTDLFHELDKLQISFHNYADDIQIWSSYDPKSSTDEVACRNRLSYAFDVISRWMHDHFLKLNSSKTVFLPISRDPNALTLCQPFQLGEALILPSSESRNLGVLFQTNFSFSNHISKVRQACFLQLRRLQLCRDFVPSSLLKTLVHAFITSRVDFCNSLYYGLPVHQIRRLQSVLNASAKFITRRKKFDSASAALKQLHWLPMDKRIIYKLSITAFHLYNRTKFFPSYLCAHREIWEYLWV